MKKFYETGEFPREARGGDRKTEKYAEKKNLFIVLFKISNV